MPAIKYTIAAIPIAMQLGNSVRHGIREVQVLASYLIHRAARSGRSSRKRGLVTALALSISLDPERRPDLEPHPGAAARRARPALDHALDAQGIGQDRRPARPAGRRRRRPARPPGGLQRLGSAYGLTPRFNFSGRPADDPSCFALPVRTRARSASCSWC